MPLQSSRFKGDPVLEGCLTGATKLRTGAVGPAVKKVQQALVDRHCLLPHFGTDGKFGKETTAAVMQFQQKHTLQADGVIGPKTMDALDKAFPEGGAGGGLAPGLHWGVDSAAPADFPIRDDAGHLTTLFDAVVSELGTIPEFWGRYLHHVPGVAAGLTKKEVDFIFSKSDGRCRILLVANIASIHFSLGFNVGVSDGRGALAAARKLEVPSGVFIFADVEPSVRCSEGWFRGWWDTMEKAGRGRGGIYEVAKDPLFFKPYREALKATLSPLHKSLNPDPVFFVPDPPETARLLWAQRPLAIAVGSTTNSAGFKRAGDIPFNPDHPDFCPGVTVLWQYALKFFVIPGNRNSQIDMDLANIQGFKRLWNARGSRN